MESELPDRRKLLLYAVVFEAGMGVVACVIAWFAEVPVWEDVLWTWSGVAYGVAATTPLLAGFVLFWLWPVGPIGSIKKFWDEVIVPLFRQCTILEIAFISILAGFGEELFFRGLLQTLFTAWWGAPIALAAASVLFGLVHPFTPSYTVLAAITGVYLGWTYQATENLLVPIIAHGLYDFIALVVLARHREAS